MRTGEDDFHIGFRNPDRNWVGHAPSQFRFKTGHVLEIKTSASDSGIQTGTFLGFPGSDFRFLIKKDAAY